MPEQRGVRAVDEVGAEVDELYANAPDAFTKKRDELAKRLKAEGKGDASASVKALRKPTQIAYVLNQVARRFANEVGELVEVPIVGAQLEEKTARDEQAEARAACDEAKARAELLGRQAADARETAEALRARAKRLAKEARDTERAAAQAETNADKTKSSAKTAAREASRLATTARKS